MRNLGLGWMAVLAVVCLAGSVRADDTKKAKHATKKFKKMDKNGDGSLTSDEFVNFTPKHLKHEGKNRATHRAKKFDKIDTNHDGKISLDEFIAWKEAHHGKGKGKGAHKGKHKDATNGAAPAPSPAPAP